MRPGSTHEPSSTSSSPEIAPGNVLFTGKKFDFVQIDVPERGPGGVPTGRSLPRHMIRHPGAAVIVPILRKGGRTSIVLIKSTRPTLGTTIWECPAGTIEAGPDRRSHAEAPSLCAARELEEETGYRAGSLTPLGSFFTTPGMTNELMWAFAADDLTYVGQRLEADEQIAAVPTPVSEVLAMIDSGALMDAKSMLAVLIAHRRGLV